MGGGGGVGGREAAVLVEQTDHGDAEPRQPRRGRDAEQGDQLERVPQRGAHGVGVTQGGVPGHDWQGDGADGHAEESDG
jgi:hypothetical protein